MNLFIRIALIAVGIALLISNLLYWWEFDSMSSSEIRVRRAGVLLVLLSTARYCILPAMCFAAANFIGGKPFLPEKFSRNALYFLAVVSMVHAGWETYSTHLVLIEMTAADESPFLRAFRSLLWPAAVSALALFFAQQFSPMNRWDDFNQD